MRCADVAPRALWLINGDWATSVVAHRFIARAGRGGVTPHSFQSQFEEVQDEAKGVPYKIVKAPTETPT
jgi:hypothetical protein